MTRISLQTRLVIAATVILAVFLGIAGWVLDRAFRETVETAVEGRLQGQLYGLLGAAELNPGGELEMPGELAEPRLGRPGSGLVAQLVDGDGRLLWQSRSALGHALPGLPSRSIGEARFARVPLDDKHWFSYAYGVAWLDESDAEHRFTFRVLESPAVFEAQVEIFRGSLIVWLGGAALVLLLLQALILRWGLAPLRRVEAEVRAIETGQREAVDEALPRELRGLAANLNLLIGNERRHLERYRNALADLAHSMKTPLAVLRNSCESPLTETELHEVIDRQVDVMNELVDYQLQRAAMAGRTSLTRGVAVDAVVARLVGSLRKVYQDRQIDFHITQPTGLQFHGEEGDLIELLGNLLDNACKWCREQVWLDVTVLADSTGKATGIRLVVDDDGAGFGVVDPTQLLARGSRGDRERSGHGIGLAVVNEIIAAYHGSLSMERSPYGGARVIAELCY